MDVRRLDLANAQQSIPVSAQPIERGVSIGGFRYLAMTGFTVFLLMVCESGGSNFSVLWILVISEHEDDLLRLARARSSFTLVRSDGRPAVRHGVRGFSAFDHGWILPSAIRAQE